MDGKSNVCGAGRNAEQSKSEQLRDAIAVELCNAEKRRWDKAVRAAGDVAVVLGTPILEPSMFMLRADRLILDEQRVSASHAVLKRLQSAAMECGTDSYTGYERKGREPDAPAGMNLIPSEYGTFYATQDFADKYYAARAAERAHGPEFDRPLAQALGAGVAGTATEARCQHDPELTLSSLKDPLTRHF